MCEQVIEDCVIVIPPTPSSLPRPTSISSLELPIDEEVTATPTQLFSQPFTTQTPSYQVVYYDSYEDGVQSFDDIQLRKELLKQIDYLDSRSFSNLISLILLILLILIILSIILTLAWLYCKMRTPKVKNGINKLYKMKPVDLRNIRSIEFMAPLSDIQIKKLETFGLPYGGFYHEKNIGRLWFAMQYNNDHCFLTVNIIKAQNLHSLCNQTQPSTFVRVAVIVNGQCDKQEHYDTILIANSRNPFYLNALNIPLKEYEIAVTMLVICVFEVHEKKQKRLGFVFYPLNKFATQTHNCRYVWRDLVINKPYNVVNKPVSSQLYQFANYHNLSPIELIDGEYMLTLHPNTPTPFYCDTELAYDQNSELLKVVIFNIITDTPNGKFVSIQLNGYVDTEYVFKEDGPKCKLTSNVNKYSASYQVTVKRDEISDILVNYKLLEIYNDPTPTG